MKRSFNLGVALTIACIAMFVFGCRNTNITDTTETTYYKEDGKVIDKVVKVTKSESVELPTTGKEVDFDDDIYAISASIVDAKTGNISPYLYLGFCKIKYKSMPAKAGQPYFVQYKEYSTSWWNWTSFFTGTPETKTDLVSETTIWIGKIPEEGKELEVTLKSGNGIKVSGDGFETESVKVSVKN